METKFLEGGIPKVAEVLGLSIQTVYIHARQDDFPFIKKVGSRYVVIEPAFNEWMFSSALDTVKELRADNV